jgi:hypothetical protein
MRKEKINEVKSGATLNIDLTSLPLETDQEVLEQINKRNEENQALKKLLENLNSSLPKHETKSPKS